MRARITPWMVFSFSCVTAVVAATACSGSDSSTPGPKSSGDDGGSTTTPPDAPPNPPAPPTPPPGPQPVTFAYAPSWAGVTKVEVLGAFGHADDWTTPLLTLVDDGTGTYRGSSTLVSGSYPYVFRVTGDEAAGAKAATYVHYAIDPADPAFVACPAASPTYSKAEPNPCSQLTVPQPSPATLSSVHGVVKLAGTPIAGYLVVLERMEPSSHHFFVDRATTAADGKLMLRAAAGTYRLQVLHPTYYSKTDAQRSPDDLGAVRRALSGSFMLDKDVTLDAAEVAYGGYAAMSPRGSATLPLTLEYALLSGATKAQAALYGPGGEIGDPWWTSSYGTATSATFDGGWDTNKAPDGGVDAAATYYWGTEQIYAARDGGVPWTAQSMVFPVQLP